MAPLFTWRYHEYSIFAKSVTFFSHFNVGGAWSCLNYFPREYIQFYFYSKII